MSATLAYRSMAYNNAWANHRLLSACLRLSQDEFTAPRVGFFPSLSATLNHILGWCYNDQRVIKYFFKQLAHGFQGMQGQM